MKLLLAVVGIVLVVIHASCAGEESPQTARPTTTSTATPAPAAAGGARTEPTITPNDAEAAIATCTDKLQPPGGDGQTRAATASLLWECLTARVPSARVIPLEGAAPVLLATVHLGWCFDDNFVVWAETQSWSWQPILRPAGADAIHPITSADDRRAAGLIPPSPQRLHIVDGRTLLAAIFLDNGCSSAPEMRLRLFEYESGRWGMTWDAGGSAIGPLSHTEIAFEGDGIETVRVRGDSWLLPDEKSRIFLEANPGPHRYFIQTWALRGNGYVLTEERVEPSAYATLVEFIYRLRTGDQEGARQLTASLRPVSRAEALGLVPQPLGQRWVVNLDRETVCCGPIEIVDGPPKPVRVSFVQRVGTWLISEIEALP